ncbi:hypothetical protein EG68_04803 [Paragonimus skrjabini miyazakii]|uniref:Uncharacterized protein n=1 Tax=Paragonimus skrjabini miyazakii TaxID=59628 RepID=A0A8S9YVZ7_9TREM|nr:hypothetical protein EG68_04803 [Paragonimus skrjabini miyazakii]
MYIGEIERSFAFYSSLLAFKTLVLTGLTIIRRFKYGAFCKSAQNSEVEAVRRLTLTTRTRQHIHRIVAIKE